MTNGDKREGDPGVAAGEMAFSVILSGICGSVDAAAKMLAEASGEEVLIWQVRLYRTFGAMLTQLGEVIKTTGGRGDVARERIKTSLEAFFRSYEE
jgi:hypothetical protein